MSQRDDRPAAGAEEPGQNVDATRRTHLANERTYLAWWRTGVTAFAAGIGVGRVVPGVTHQARWPYAIVGAGFALLGIVAVAYGYIRQREVRNALAAGKFAHPRDGMLLVFSGVGLALGCLLLVIVVGDL